MHRWEEDRPGLKELINALSETRDLMRREIKARTEALASGGAAAQAVGAGVTTGFNVIQVRLPVPGPLWRTGGGIAGLVALGAVQMNRTSVSSH